MSSRLSWVLVLLLSVGVVGAVAAYYGIAITEAKRRERLLVDLARSAKEDGACATLAMARAIHGPMDERLTSTVTAQRFDAVKQIVMVEDVKARNAFLAADADGLIDRGLCEQIQLSSSLGEMHPILVLLRLTRGRGEACEVSFQPGEVLAALTTHRGIMLKALLEDAGRLKCMSPSQQQQVVRYVLATLWTEPAAFDELDPLRVASFLTQWAPVESAQLACWLEAREASSKIGNAIGCTQDHRNRVLLRYRYSSPLPGLNNAPAVPAGSEVFLLRSSEGQCDVRPTHEPARMYTVSCGDLSLASDVDVAVLMEPIVFGQVRASLIAGVVHYQGGGDRLVKTPRDEPQVGTWFAYDRAGMPAGMTEVVALRDLASRVGEALPDNPLRAFCRQAGAKYCYDVDWAQVVSQLDGEPVVFLSRPLDVFVREVKGAPEVAAPLFAEAFGRAPPTGEGAVARVFSIGDDAYLVLEVQPSSVQARWRLTAGGPWSKQGFGAEEGGKVPPAARLLAVLDLQQDGRPELVVQRANRVLEKGELRAVSDEVLFMGLDAKGTRFEVVNRLTVREY